MILIRIDSNRIHRDRLDLERIRQGQLVDASLHVSSFPTAIVNGAISQYLYSCTKRQQKLLLEAWAEAGVLANAHNEWWPGSKCRGSINLEHKSYPTDEYLFLEPQYRLLCSTSLLSLPSLPLSLFFLTF